MGTLLDLASLVMIPSGVKEDKLYSVKPTDGSGDFTFSRNSDIQATRVNSSGLIEKAKVNLFDYSNDFSNWTLASITPTSGQSGYDGSSDAWELDKTNTGGAIINPTSLTGVGTCSVYAKAGTLDFLLFYINYNSGTDTQAYFDLSSGSVGTTIAVIDANIEQVGSTDWYRCDVSFNCPSTLADVRIFPALADNNSGGTGTIYIQDAQLNYGLVAQDYVETTTTSVVEGLTADLPRLDYSGGASCPSLLLEGSRTNSVLQSEYFGTYWSPNQMSVSSNVDTSPEGVVNAGLLIPSTSSTSTHRVRGVVSVTAGQNHTFSCFFKKENYAYAQLRSGTGWQINVDLNDGSFTTSGTSLVDGDVEDYGNGWYRAYVVGTEAGTSQGFDISVFDSDSFGGFAGDGTSGVLAYGAMVEQGSYPTSYIPTYGASAVRGNDVVNEITGVSDLIGQTEGTLFVHTDAFLSGVTSGNRKAYFYLSDGTFNNRIELSKRGGTTTGLADDIAIRISSGGVTAFDQTIAQDFSGEVKIAFAYKNGDVAAYINGSSVYTNTGSVSIPATSEITIGNGYNEPLREPMKQALLFKTRLTNAELSALTTI